MARDREAWHAAVHGVENVKEVTWPCPTLCDPMDYTVHGILQARIVEWVVFLFYRGSSQPRDRTQVSCIAGGFFTNQVTREAQSKSRTRLSDVTLTFHFHALKKEMATHSSVLAWRIPGMGEPCGLLPLGSHRVGHD